MADTETTTTSTTLSPRSAALQAALRSDGKRGNFPSVAADTQRRRDARAPGLKLRRAPVRSLVLAQSWVPYSVAQREPASLRQSALRAAQAFTLLSSALATHRGEATPPTA